MALEEFYKKVFEGRQNSDLMLPQKRKEITLNEAFSTYKYPIIGTFNV